MQRSASTSRARRVAVPADEPLLGGEAWDYADAFEITVPAQDGRSAEHFARTALERAPWPVRQTVWIVHRHVLRARLGPRSSPEHVLGWTILTSEPDVVCLQALSPLLGRGVIVGRRVSPTTVVVTTRIFFTRPRLARAVWAITGPLHRRVAPYLMERAAAVAAHQTAVAA